MNNFFKSTAVKCPFACVSKAYHTKDEREPVEGIRSRSRKPMPYAVALDVPPNKAAPLAWSVNEDLAVWPIEGQSMARRKVAPYGDRRRASALVRRSLGGDGC